MGPVEAVLVGAGQRGRHVYGAWARSHPDRLRIVALAEPEPGRRQAVASEHALAAGAVFDDWRPLLAAPARAPVALIATGDTLHVEPALAALAAGYHVLLEKPIAPDPVDCLRVVEAAERSGRILQISHVLRHTDFYRRVHEVVRSGRLGELVTLDLKEHVAHWHFAHSYVRGKFRKRAIAAPAILAKSCHDLDLLAWIAGRPARRLASFGGLLHYCAGDAPAGAPGRCTDGCPVQADCVHDAVRFYVDPPDGVAGFWPWSDLSPDPSRAARRAAVERGPYGVCVYRADNDVADHQVVAVEFEGGATATFTLHGSATHERRTLRISGTRGELRGVLHDGQIEVTRHGSLDVERFACPGSEIGHFGGDEGLIEHFLAQVAGDADTAAVHASARVALESHLLGFAADWSRTSGRTVDMSAYREEIAAALA